MRNRKILFTCMFTLLSFGIATTSSATLYTSSINFWGDAQLKVVHPEKKEIKPANELLSLEQSVEKNLNQNLKNPSWS